MRLLKRAPAAPTTSRSKVSPSKAKAPEDAISVNPDKAAASQLSDMAKRVPVVKRTGDEAKYNRALLARNALIHATDLLEKNPSMTLETWSWLDGKINGKHDTSDDFWDDSYSNWVKAPLGGPHLPSMRIPFPKFQCFPNSRTSHL